MRLILWLLPPLLAAAGPSAAQEARGKRLFLQCQACHTLEKGAPHKVGPNLHAFVGKPPAKQAGYKYSPALANAKIVWDEATLDRWLARPSAVVPGNKMVYGGMAKPEDRKALIAYLREATR